MDTEAERAWIVGLGNPGKRYARSRHNAGFWVVDAFARESGLAFGAASRKFRAEIQEARLSPPARFRSVVLVKPETYMNLSGEAVRDLLGYFRTPREGDLADQLIVVHDDLDLPLGKWRFRKQGSAGGHRGVASIIQCLGHDRFGRLKVGIGRPREGTEAADYVLETISASERETIDRLVREAARMLSVWLESGIETCMNRFNHASLDLGSEEGDAESGSSSSHRGAPPPANRSAADRDPI